MFGRHMFRCQRRGRAASGRLGRKAGSAAICATHNEVPAVPALRRSGDNLITYNGLCRYGRYAGGIVDGLGETC